jgi:hypothetical protein
MCRWTCDANPEGSFVVETRHSIVHELANMLRLPVLLRPWIEPPETGARQPPVTTVL